jgi:FAD dependent oxidoreductase TIGR03364
MVCSGADFETLFPELFSALAITKCKLQMMRMVAQPNHWKLGPSLCGGLSLIHYKSFEAAPSLPILRGYFEHHLPQYVQWGIHVMACQNGAGEITVGDTHEYGLDLDPFDKHYLNNWVVDYLKSFCALPSFEVMQTWNGTYAKMKNGQTEWVHQAGDNIWLVNGMGGAGMTLSFGLAQEVLDRCGA